MLKKLIERYGVVNANVSHAEVYDCLAERFPDVKIVNKSTDRAIRIVARSGLGKLTIGRHKNGSFQFNADVAGFYSLITLGLADVFSGLAGRKKFLEITTFMRERFHTPQTI
jgi:hypothetical protein